jgi:hypothetical protein
MITNLNNSKKYRAKVRSITMPTGKFIEVESSIETPDSCYGFQHWVDAKGNSYGQIIFESPFYEVFDIVEIEQ